MDELKFIEYAQKVFAVAGWEFCGVFLAQLLATRGTNFWKAVVRAFKMHWHPLVWHSITFVQAFALSFISFQFKYENYAAIAFVSFILACFNAAIVEWMHRKAQKNDTANAVFNKMVFIAPEDDDMVTRLGAFAVGMNIKVDARHDKREVKVPELEEAYEKTRRLTPKEQADITGSHKIGNK